jgi:hypothetical protein
VSGRLVLEASMSGSMLAVRNGREVGLGVCMLDELSQERFGKTASNPNQITLRMPITFERPVATRYHYQLCRQGNFHKNGYMYIYDW